MLDRPRGCSGGGLSRRAAGPPPLPAGRKAGRLVRRLGQCSAMSPEPGKPRIPVRRDTPARERGVVAPSLSLDQATPLENLQFVEHGQFARSEPTVDLEVNVSRAPIAAAPRNHIEENTLT